MSQISQKNFRRRLTRALVLPLLLMIILAASLIAQIAQLTSVMQWVSHTDEVIAKANHTEKLIVDLETGVRGYLVTGNSEFLEPYQQANSVLDSTFNQFTRLISDNPSQLKRLREVRSHYEQWNRYAQQMIALRQQGGDYQSYAINAKGKKLMDTIRSKMASFIQTEEVLRNARTRTAQQTTQWVLFMRLCLTFGIGGILAVFTRRQLIAVAQSYGHALAVAQEQTEALRDSEAALRRSAQRLASLHLIDRSILEAHSSEALIRAALSRMRQLVPYQQAFVVLFNFQTRTAQILAGIENGDFRREGTTMPIEDFEPDVALQQEILYVEDIAAVESCSPALSRLLSAGAGSYLTIPLVVEENLIGELNLVATQKAAFAPEDQEIAKEVADQLAIAMQQSNLREELQRYTSELEQRVAQRTAALEETNSELEAFSYSVSHDLRAPLRTMQGFTQALLEDYGSQLDSIGQDYARYIVESAVQMDTLISELLTYSRLSRVEIQIQPIDLSVVVAVVLRQLDVELQQRQAQVTVEEPLPQVMAHRTTLAQILTNLLTNAFKFVAPGVQPRIRVWAEEREEEDAKTPRHAQEGNSRLAASPHLPLSASNSEPQTLTAPQGKWIRLWVEDNGIGIAVEHQERIFRVFERLHGVETYPGTGIGLALVRKGIERMGGRVGVDSQPNQGSRFWIELVKSEE